MSMILKSPAGLKQVVTLSSTEPLVLDFSLDSTVFSRFGKALVIAFEDGGALILEDFYAGSFTKAPDFVINGFQTTATQFLSRFADPELTEWEDSETRAIRKNKSGGAGEYEDDAGGIVDDVDRLDALGTIYWNNAIAGVEKLAPLPFYGFSENGFGSRSDNGGNNNGGGEYTGPPTGTTTLSFISNGASGGYENWRPYLNAGDETIVYTQLSMAFAPGPNSACASVELSGFNPGTLVYLGDPANNIFIEITSLDMSVTLTQAQFNAGVYVMSPGSDDASVNAIVTLQNTVTGETAHYAQTVPLVIDAVAQKPFLDFAYTNDNGEDEEFCLTRPVSGPIVANTHGKPEETPVSFNFTMHLDRGVSTFEYEKHFVELRGVPLDWELDPSSLPPGCSIVDPATIPNPEHPTAVAAGTKTICVFVDKTALDPLGDINFSLTFDPKDWTDSRLGDGTPNPYGPATVSIAAISWEPAQQGGNELTLGNNYSETVICAVVCRMESAPEITVDANNVAGAISVNMTNGAASASTAAIQADAETQAIATRLGADMALAQSAASGQIAFDLKFDPANDPNHTGDNQAAVTWDAAITAQLLAVYPEDANTSRPVTFSIEQADLGNGPVDVLVGRYFDGANVRQIAFFAYIEPDFATNSVTITMVQFVSLASPSGTTTETVPFELRAGIVATDADGDTDTATLQADFYAKPGDPGVNDPAKGVVAVRIDANGNSYIAEDSMPDFDQGDTTKEYARIVADQTLEANTVLDSVTVSGFPAGTVLYMASTPGDTPGTGGGTFITVTGTDQKILLSPAAIANGVYVLPIPDSAADFAIHSEVALSNTVSGLTSSTPQTTAVRTDAVADRGGLEISYIDQNGILVSGPAAAPDSQAPAPSISITQPEETLIRLQLYGTFGDYASGDGEEIHSFVIAGIPADWTYDPANFPAGSTVIRTDAGDFYTLEIIVPNALVAAGDGDVSFPAVFDPHEWTDERLNNGAPNPDGQAELTVSVKSVDQELSGEPDPNPANNTALNTINVTVSVIESKPDILEPAPGFALDINANTTTGMPAPDTASTLAAQPVQDVLAFLGFRDDPAISASSGEIRFTYGQDATRPDLGTTGSIAVDATGLPATIQTGDGKPVVFSAQTVVIDGTTYTVVTGVYQDGGDKPAFVAILDPAATSGGVYIVQFTPLIDTADPGQPFALPIRVVATDADGDRDVSVINVDVNKTAAPPTGTVAVSVSSGGQAGTVYEDSMPDKNTGDFDKTYAALVIDQSGLGPDTVISSVTASGLPPGTVIYLGDPADPATTAIVAPAEGTVTLSPADITQPMHIEAPAGSSEDFTLHAAVTLTNTGSGLSIVHNADIPVTVDAVADKPSLGIAGSSNGESLGYVAVDPLRDPGAASETFTSVPEQSPVTMTLAAVFKDALDPGVTDADYSFIVKGVPADWTYDALPAGFTLVKGPEYDVGGQKHYDITVDVAPSVIGANGAVSVPLTFDPHDWTNERLNNGEPKPDGGAVLTVTAKSTILATDGDTRADNNTAETTATITINVAESKPAITLDGDNLAMNLATNEASGNATPQAQAVLQSQTVAAALQQAGLDAADAIAASSGVVTFTLGRDGPADPNHTGTDNLCSLAWDPATLPAGLKTTADHTGDGSLTYVIASETYVIDGKPVQVGIVTAYYTNSGGNQQPAFMAALTPNLAGGTANISFVQFAPLEHANGAPLPVGLGIILVDADGDATPVAPVKITVADAPFTTPPPPQFLEFSEKDFIDSGTFAQTNMLTGAVPGADAFGGLQTVTITVDGVAVYADQILTPGTPTRFIIHNGDGTEAGTLTVGYDGAAAFTLAPGQNVHNAMTVVVYGEAVDRDGSSAPAQAVFTIQAAPTLVTLAANTASITESGPDNAVTYTVSLKDYADKTSPAPAESIAGTTSVPIKVALGSASLADFALSESGGALFIEYTYMDNGVPQTGQAAITLAPDGKSFVFVLPVPQAAEGTLQFTLTAIDDALGGPGSLHDAASETFTVSLFEGVFNGQNYAISGPSPTVVYTPESSASVAITDDNASGGVYYAAVGDYVPGAPLPEGPVIELAPPATVNEGQQAQIGFSFTTLEADGTHAAPWTGTLGEPTTVTFALNNGTATTDGAPGGGKLLLSASLLDLLASGKVALANAVNGAEIALDNGSVTFVLQPGFSNADLAGLQFLLTVADDGIVEADQQLTLALTGANGNESLFDGGAKTVVVKDAANPYPSPYSPYVDLESAGTGMPGEPTRLTVSLVSGPAYDTPYGGDVKGPVDLTLAFTPTPKDLHPGGAVAEGAQAVSDYLPGMASYPDWNAPDALAALAAQLNLPSGVTITTATYNDPAGGFTVTLHADATAWSGDGKSFSFDVPIAQDNLAGEPTEAFTVTVAGHAQTTPGNQEIAGIAPGGGSTEIDICDVPLVLGLSSDVHSINEDANPHFVHYAVNWSYANLPSAPPGVQPAANADFTFSVSLQDMDAAFAPDGVNGDYAWAVPNTLLGGYETYTLDVTNALGRAGLELAIQNELDALYGNNNVTVSVSGDGRTLTFAVKEGTLLGAPLPIHVGAIDDAQEDGGETFALTLALGANDPDRVDLAIADNQNSATIVIIDNDAHYGPQNYMIGMLNAATTATEADMTLQAAVVLYDQNGAGFATPADAAAAVPANDVRLFLGHGQNDTATYGADYTARLDITVPGGGWTVKKLVNGELAETSDPRDGTYVIVAYMDVTIIDDALTEGAETFTLYVDAATGVNATPLPSAGNSFTATLLDDAATTPDGPVFTGFTTSQAGDVLPEPTHPDLSSSDPAASPNSVVYTLNFDKPAAPTQGVIAWLDVSGTATLGSDYSLQYGNINAIAAGGVFKVSDFAALKAALLANGYAPPATPPPGADYFVLVPRGEDSASFTVNVLHDHKTEGAESINWKLVGLDGGEDAFSPAPAINESHKNIVDDGNGPTVTLAGVDANPTAGTTDSVTVTFGDNTTVTADEDITVTVRMTFAPGEYRDHTVVIPAGSNSALLQLDVPGRDYTLAIIGATGGEAQTDGTTYAVDINGTVTPDNGVSLSLAMVSDLTEANGGSYLRYTVTGVVGSRFAGGDVSFDLYLTQGATSAADFDPLNTLRVALPENIVEQLKGKSFELSVAPDADGYPVLSLVSNGVSYPLPAGTYPQLPHAKPDNIIETTEVFTGNLGNLGGYAYVGGSSSRNANLYNDKDVTICIDAIPDNGVEGGAAVSVVLSLMDADGAPLAAGSGPLTFKLIFTGENAVQGVDFAPSSVYVTIPAGSASGSISVAFPENFISNELPRSFTVSAELVHDQAFAANYPTPPIFVASPPVTVDIAEHINGPQYCIEAVGHSIQEGGTAEFEIATSFPVAENASFDVTVCIEEFPTGMTIEDVVSRLVLKDPVTAEIRLDLDLDAFLSDDAFRLQLQGSLEAHLDGSALLRFVCDNVSYLLAIAPDGRSFTLNVPIAQGSDSVILSVETKNDPLTVLPDTAKVSAEITGSHKAEMLPGDCLCDSVTVADVPLVPEVMLILGGGDPINEVDEGHHAILPIGLSVLSGLGVIQRDTTVRLKVTDPEVLENGTVTLYTQKILGPDFDRQTYALDADGYVTIVVPALTLAVQIGFNTRDNSNANNQEGLDANPPLLVEIVPEGSTGSVPESFPLLAVPIIDLLFPQTVSYTMVGAQLQISAGVVRYCLDNVNAADILNVQINGYAVKVLSDNGRTYVETVAPPLLPITDVLSITFQNNANLAANKANLAIDGTFKPTGVVIITEDPLSPDGPEFAVEADAAFVSENGGTATFTITGAPKLGFEASDDETNIRILFKLTGSYSDRAQSVSVPEGGVLSGPNSDGVYTLKLPVGTDFRTWMGKISVTLKGADGVIADNGSLGVALLDSDYGESGIDEHNDHAGMTVTEATTGALSLQQLTTSVNEGQDHVMRLALTDGGGNPVIATRDMSVTLTVQGFAPPGGAAATLGGPYSDMNLPLPDNWTYNGDGTYTVIVTLPAGGSSAYLRIPTESDGYVELTEGIRCSVVSSQVPAGVVPPTPGGAFDFTIKDTTSSGKLVVSAVNAAAHEGETLGMALNLQTALGADMPASEPVVAVFTASGYTPLLGHKGNMNDLVASNTTDAYGNTIVWTYNAVSDTYTVTATLAPGQSRLYVSALAKEDGINELTEGIRFTLNAVTFPPPMTGKVSAVTGLLGLDPAIGNAFNFTVQDTSLLPLLAPMAGGMDADPAAALAANSSLALLTAVGIAAMDTENAGQNQTATATAFADAPELPLLPETTPETSPAFSPQRYMTATAQPAEVPAIQEAAPATRLAAEPAAPATSKAGHAQNDAEENALAFAAFDATDKEELFADAHTMQLTPDSGNAANTSLPEDLVLGENSPHAEAVGGLLYDETTPETAPIAVEDMIAANADIAQTQNAWRLAPDAAAEAARVFEFAAMDELPDMSVGYDEQTLLTMMQYVS